MIDNSCIIEIKQRLDIVDVIGRQINLKKTGKNYSACCPFHDEKTPSFSVNQKKQFFYCFGCGATGDVISFHSRYNNFSFIDAVNDLSKMAGIGLSKTGEVLIPRKVKDMMLDDKMIMIMSEEYDKTGVKMSYKDKQRKRLAENRYTELERRWLK